jgi:hypothetical protein
MFSNGVSGELTFVNLISNETIISEYATITNATCIYPPIFIQREFTLYMDYDCFYENKQVNNN